MARHRSRSASASDARWWLIVPAACSNPRAELDSSADPYAIRQWCFRLPPMCPAPSARFNATDDAARISWSAIGFNGPRTVAANSIVASAARCAITCAASFGDGVVMCSMVTSAVFMPMPQTVESKWGQGSPWRFTMPLPPFGFDGYCPLRTPRRSPWGTSATVSRSVPGPRTRGRTRTRPPRSTLTPAAGSASASAAASASASARGSVTAGSAGARYGLGCDGFLVAWASSPRMNHRLSERRPHGGQDAHRTMGSIARVPADIRYRHGRSGVPSARDSVRVRVGDSDSEGPSTETPFPPATQPPPRVRVECF
jgi:hypothetical protein